jgi:FlaA1/EpsC-like NDP-sugar epimerase
MNRPLVNRRLICRKLLIVLTQTFLFGLAYCCSFLVYLNFNIDFPIWKTFLHTLPFVAAIKLVLFYRYGLLRGWWRYSGMSDLLDLTQAATVSSLIVFCGSRLLFPSHPYSRAVIILDFAFTILVTGGARFAVRAYTETVGRVATGKRTLIVGASQAGRALAQELKQNPELNYELVGFVDDDPRKSKIRINGISVLGNIDDLSRVIIAYDIARVIIAIPSAQGKQVERVITACRARNVDFKILPPIADRINGPQIGKVRSVRVEDLLGREPVQLETHAIRNKLHGKTVLITGAGGSIGSELARQVASFGPRKLVLFERSENDLFNIWTGLSAKFPHLQIVPVVGDILDVSMLRETFAQHRPDSVFHAAAYKHVPLMERSCFQAVTNNIFGTYNVAIVAKQYHVEDFVLISSDKAVNPTNVMGVTKRVAELIMLGLQRQGTKYMAVRFGNVLASNGSVVPIFERQIAAGGPVTVTHPEMQRYFMTIPEAVQLVLQAATMGRGGEIFVLDMGEPVRILDLAKNLIRLSGLDAERDIKIVFTGLRPGEKLFEELMLEGEDIRTTSHGKIRVLESGDVEFEQIAGWLRELSSLVESKNVHSIVTKLRKIVPEYSPSPEMLTLGDLDRLDIALITRSRQADLWVGIQGAA